jgi:hypothetical protein
VSSCCDNAMYTLPFKFVILRVCEYILAPFFVDLLLFVQLELSMHFLPLFFIFVHY